MSIVQLLARQNAILRRNNLEYQLFRNNDAQYGMLRNLSFNGGMNDLENVHAYENMLLMDRISANTELMAVNAELNSLNSSKSLDYLA